MTIDYVATLAEQSELFHAAAAWPEALRQPVSACPGWTVANLVEHLGAVQVFWTHAVRAAGGPLDEQAVRQTQKPAGDLLEWGRQASEGLLAALRETPAHRTAFCWWNDSKRASVAELASRQAHEALVHRWDAEAAVTHPSPADPHLWADGVDEFATRFLNGPAWSGPAGVVELLADDLGLRWRFGVGSASSREGGRPEWLRDRPAPEPDATVSATAEQVDLLLWRRVEADRGHVRGDSELFFSFAGWADLD